jgi:adenosylcobyric acid synthase
MGRLERHARASGVFVIAQRNGQPEDDRDGDVSHGGAVIGTMIHGLFENARLRATLIANLRRKKGLPVAAAVDGVGGGDEYDRLADVVRSHVRMDLLRRLATQ